MVLTVVVVRGIVVGFLVSIESCRGCERVLGGFWRPFKDFTSLVTKGPLVLLVVTSKVLV